MFRYGAVLAVASLILCACNAASSSPPNTSAKASLGPTGTPPQACGGVAVPLMRIHIASDGSSTGDLLDTNAGNAVTGTYKLMWPDGYAARIEAGVQVIVNSTGEVVAREGSTLTDVQVCRDGGVLALTEPIAPATSSP